MLSFSKIALDCGCAIALLATLAPADAQGPQTPPPASPAAIILPRKLEGGSRATLAVLDPDGHLVAGAAVELSGFGEVKTDATGRAAFVAPVDAASLEADLKMGGAPTIVPIVPAAIHNEGSAVTVPQIAAAPKVIALGEPFDIGGNGFSGDASQDRVAIGDQPALVLAASPLSIVALPNPGASVGDAQLSVTAQGQRAGSRPVTLISLDLAGPANPLIAGATSTFVVRVAGSAKPVIVQVNNSTPDVVDLPGGNIRRVVTGGGSSNSATLPVVSIRPGDYAVSVRLLPVMQGAPDVETARLELIDARRTADAKWQKKIDSLLVLLKRQPRDIPRVQQEIVKQLHEHPPARIDDSFRVASLLLAAS